MRIFEIDHTVLAESVDTTSVKFRSWFYGSMVVDQNGQPLVCHHGTNDAGAFAQFRPLSHFGTAGAANSIINSRQFDMASIIPVYLSIKQPLRYRDSGQNSNSTISDVVQSTDPSLWDGMSSDELDWMQEDDTGDRARFFIDHLTDAGHDGLVYENAVENLGSTSWVIFSPRQVWPIYQPGHDDATDETPREELLRLALQHHADKAPATIEAQIDRLDDHDLPAVLDRYRKLVPL